VRVYRERLGVPIWWWLATLAGVLLLGSMLWTVLPTALGIASYAVLGTASVALLHFWGAVTIEVTGTELRSGSQSLDLAAIGEVAAMDLAQTRALRGPQANPAAYLLIRPYLPKSVYVEVAGQPRRWPYWLIATRNPAGLAAAIDDARRADHDRTCDDAGGEREDSARASRRRVERERAEGRGAALESRGFQGSLPGPARGAGFATREGGASRAPGVSGKGSANNAW
jgi:Protein of unknown function (DUF3093)